MPKMTPEEGRAYIQRWQLVRSLEIAELRRASPETKMWQLAALMASGDIFGPDLDRDAETVEVRERWAHLRRALRG
jgi:hypothetical protein